MRRAGRGAGEAGKGMRDKGGEGRWRDGEKEERGKRKGQAHGAIINHQEAGEAIDSTLGARFA